MRPSCLAALLLTAQQGVAEPLFEPVAAPSHVYEGGWEHFVGGGIASFDCNGDHLPELFVAGGTQPAQLMRNLSDRAGAIVYKAETPASLALTSVIGAYPLDIDSDGVMDLAILRVGENLLLHGGADCSFAPFADLDFQSGEQWTTAFSATWEDGQTLPTLAFGNYVDRSDQNGPFRACDTNMLYRPEATHYGNGLALEPGYCALSMLFSDWNRTGRADLRISNDRHYYVDNGSEQLWAMEATPRLFTAQDGWIKHQLWGMGIASRDITGDGLPEIYLSSMGDQRLQIRDPDIAGPAFRDAPHGRGTSAHRPYTGGDGRPSTGWHVSFGDVQNDGLDDLFVAKGNVEQMPDSAMKDPNNLLVQRDDGSFVEVGEHAGVASLHRSRGAALIDMNLDGRLDLAVVNRRAPLEIFQNKTRDTGHWLSVRLDQAPPNVNAIGAWIEVAVGNRVSAREITVGGGHASGTATPEHFGLGAATTARIRVIWPDKEPSDWQDIQADQAVVVKPSGRGLMVEPY